MDNGKKAQQHTNVVFETAEVITTKVYKTNADKKKLDRLADEKLEKAYQEAIPNIRERYEQRVKEKRRLQQQPDTD